MTDGIPGMFLNPEVHLNISDPKITIKTQVIRLKEITQRIQNAVYGADSNRIDIEEGSGQVEGSGSGSGSGVKPTDSPTDEPTRIPPGVPTTQPDNVVEIGGGKMTRSPNAIPEDDPNNPNYYVKVHKNSAAGPGAKAAVGLRPGNNAMTLSGGFLLQLILLSCFLLTSW